MGKKERNARRNWAAYLAQGAQELRDILERNEDLDPQDWPLSDKLLLLAGTFDAQDVEQGTINEHSVQDDLREAAGILANCDCT